MLPVGHDGIAMPPGQLFLAGVAIVDQHQKAGRSPEASGDSLHPAQGHEGRFDALSCFGMDTVAVEKLHLLRRRRNELFHKSSTLLRDTQGAAMVYDFDRQRVEEFIPKHDEAFSG